MANAFRIAKRICFRPTELEHASLYRAWINDPENHQFLRRYRPLNAVEEKEWLEKAHERKDDHLFEVALREGERPIGLCSLRTLEPPSRTGDLGITIGDRGEQGKGYGAEAIGLLLEYGFATLGLHRVQLCVYENNARAIRCYERCGFRREGVRREARWWAGRWWNIYDYAILEQEWQPDKTLSPRNAAK